MSVYLDKKYINLVSSSLEKFKWKKINLANCRCPLCGDSESNKNKARGYFFESDNSYFYKCHNCGISHNVYKFLEVISPALHKEYCLEQFTEKNNKPFDNVIFQQNNQEITIRSSEPHCEKIGSMSSDHKVIKFLESRKIPKDQWNRFGYTEHFSEYARNVNSDYSLFDDDRIVIPIYDEHNQFIGAQGRSFGNIKPKYITIKKDEKIKLLYGIERINKSKSIVVVEGPIDSMFISNSIACLGVGNFLEIRDRLPNQDLIFVVDNEPRNKSVVDVVQKLIERNEKVCIFPSDMKEKDINDMVLNGIDVSDMIINHTHKGAAAKLAFNSWRKI